MKKILIALLLCLLESDSHGQDNFSRVARVFGRDIYASDLNPTDDELKMIKLGTENMKKRQEESAPRPGLPQLPLPTVDEIISRGRSEKLARLIWDPIWAEFDRTHDVKPTGAEIDEHIRAMEAFTNMMPDRQLPDDPRISAKEKKEIEREVAEGFVKQWKRSKALYEEYGGIVLFTHFNPMEPFGAMRKLLEIHQAKGDFEIYDEQLKQEFWKYYLKDPLSWKVVPPDRVDYSEPWWLKKPDIPRPGTVPPPSIRDPLPPASIR